MSQFEILKYPRTPHMEGSKLQPGDDGSDQIPIAEIRAIHPTARFISEEKLDGGNAGISFDPQSLDLLLQSRGHYLRGGAREGQFNLLKEWAAHHEAELLERLEDRYICYGEWTFAMHTQFYDALPHFFHEFDIWDRREQCFLSTPRRHELLRDSPVVSVPVLRETWPGNLREIRSWVDRSLYRSEDWRDNLQAAAIAAGVDPEQAFRSAGADRPDGDLCEGLYVKTEDEERVLARYKWVRPGFLQTILDNGTHWAERPIIRNRLAEGVDLFTKPQVRSWGLPCL